MSRLELPPQAAHSFVIDSRVDQTKTSADGGSGYGYEYGSGFGYGPELLDEMTTTKVVHLGLSRR